MINVNPVNTHMPFILVILYTIAHIKDDTATLESVGVHPYCVVELSGELLDVSEILKHAPFFIRNLTPSH